MFNHETKYIYTHNHLQDARSPNHKQTQKYSPLQHKVLVSQIWFAAQPVSFKIKNARHLHLLEYFIDWLSVPTMATVLQIIVI